MDKTRCEAVAMRIVYVNTAGAIWFDLPGRVLDTDAVAVVCHAKSDEPFAAAFTALLMLTDEFTLTAEKH